MSTSTKKGLGLTQTKGSFQIMGIVTNTKSKNFYNETKTKKTEKPWRNINFGVKIDDKSTIFINLSGGEKDKVHFSKTTEVNGKKTTDVQEVEWKDRFKFNKEGYRLIGVNVGLKKTVDEKGNAINDKKILSEYDACKEVYDNLQDGQSVFIKGTIEYSHYEKNGNTSRSVKFVPNQISLCKEVNFTAEDYKSVNDFTQTIIFQSITQAEDRFAVSANIVNYNSIEDTEYIIEDKSLATIFKKNLKPYMSLKVYGKIKFTEDVEEVKETDSWGEENPMDKINTPVHRDLVIIGADKSSVDSTTYTETIISEAIETLKANSNAVKQFGDEEWGSLNTSNDKDTEDAW